jgi:hypothetical protein
MHRRRFLALGAASATAGLAGCRSLFETRSARSQPLVDDRPDAVYVPTHIEGMKMAGMTTAGDFAVALSYSFPHMFWLVDGDERTKVAIEGEDSIHLMATVWDRETGIVVPNTSVSATVRQDGDTVDDRNLWLMLSQNMAVHAGDNIPLNGDGSYEIDLDIGPVSARRTGAFADRLDASAQASFTVEFERAHLDEIRYKPLNDRKGERGAVRPMEMEMLPVAQLPATEEMPGDGIGEATSGDVSFPVFRLEDPPDGVEATGPYLVVSARTPYNDYPLPRMTLSATATRGGTTTFDDSLSPTFDPNLGFHYGAVADVQPGDDLVVSVDLPPQIARHEGYETALFEFDPMDLSV